MTTRLATLAAPPEPITQPAEAILHGDALLRLLARWRLGPLAAGLAVAAYAAVHAVLLPVLLGHWRNPALQHPARADWPYLVIAVVSVPLLWAYYVWQPHSIQTAFSGLANRLGSSATAEARLAELARPFAWRRWQWLAAGLALSQVWMWSQDIGAMTTTTWLTAHPALTLTAYPLRALGFYVVTLALIRQALVIVKLNRFFSRFTVDIAPLHPDKAGGLRMLGNYVLGSGFLIGVIGLNLSMTSLRGQAAPEYLTAEYYRELVTFFALGPLFLLLPLITVHRQMQAARARLLAEIAEQFDQEYFGLLNRLRQDKLDPDDVARLEAVQKIYNIAANAPVWPINFEIFSKFGAAVLLPLIVPLAIDWFVDWLIAR